MMHGLSDDTVQNVLKKYASQCESDGIHMPSYVHFHMLRKSRAMSLYKAGCPLSYIQQMLGHESFSTTSGFYAFAALDSLEKAIEKAIYTVEHTLSYTVKRRAYLFAVFHFITSILFSCGDYYHLQALTFRLGRQQRELISCVARI